MGPGRPEARHVGLMQPHARDPEAGLGRAAVAQVLFRPCPRGEQGWSRHQKRPRALHWEGGWAAYAFDFGSSLSTCPV